MKIYKRLLMILCGLWCGWSVLQAERVMVMSDPHVIAQTLLQPGEAADEMLASGRKMLDLSEPAFKALIDTALLHQHDLLLIAGDLTKDGEAVSHDSVAASLARLQAAGVPVLVIPGNHDISNPAAYMYSGSQKTPVANIDDAQFDQVYGAFMGAVRDPESHSYVAEPFEGVTILAIDGAHGDAGTGSLSTGTLNWLLNQADLAHAKGNLIIAMCHWQIIDHVDQMADFMAVTQLANAASIAQQLAEHHVHFVLTGHFHVNGASTKYYNSGNDSIVEVTTGAPVAYPCPYRWLDISADRSTVTVGTEELRSLGAIADLHAYSRAWQEEHTQTMLPQMALKAWGKVDSYVATMLASSSLTTRAMGTMIAAVLPQTDSARVEIFERHMGQAVVDLFMLHSDANEPERPEKDAVKDSLYTGLTNMIVEVVDLIPETMQGMMAELAISMMETPVESMTEDLTATDNPYAPNRTDDLSLVLTLQAPRTTGLDRQADERMQQTTYDLLGRPVQDAPAGQVLIQGNQKIWKQ